MVAVTLSQTDAGSYSGGVITIDSAVDPFWAVHTPTPLDLTTYASTHIDQPGTRLYYISGTHADDATGEIYFWNGTNIVDSTGSDNDGGNVYGTDPKNPSSFVKPFGRWAHVGPRKGATATYEIGTAWNGTGGGNTFLMGGTEPGFRYEKPDWWLWKRGETFDLADDFLTFVQQSTPAATETVECSLAIGGGKSYAEPAMMCAYGPTSLARPKIINPPNGFMTRAGTDTESKYQTWLSLHLDGHSVYDTGKSFSWAGNSILAKGHIMEDMWFDAVRTTINDSIHGEFIYRRSLLTDDVGGFFWNGEEDAIIRFEECLTGRNGFPLDPVLNWPPDATQIFNPLDRNFYMSGRCDPMLSGIFGTLSIMGASGDQFRCGLQYEDNFTYQGYVNMGAYGGYDRAKGPSGTIKRNVLQVLHGKDLYPLAGGTGQPAWGFSLNAGAYQVEVTGNIETLGETASMRQPAFTLQDIGQYDSQVPINYASEENNIHDNIFDATGWTTALLTSEGGLSDADAATHGWTAAKGLFNNDISTNILIGGSGTEYTYFRGEAGITQGSVDDTIHTSNTLYTDRAAAKAGEGWLDSDRSLKTYMLQYGTVALDGFDELFTLMITQRLGNWDTRWTAAPIKAYIEEGFTLDPALADLGMAVAAQEYNEYNGGAGGQFNLDFPANTGQIVGMFGMNVNDKNPLVGSGDNHATSFGYTDGTYQGCTWGMTDTEINNAQVNVRTNSDIKYLVRTQGDNAKTLTINALNVDQAVIDVQAAGVKDYKQLCLGVAFAGTNLVVKAGNFDFGASTAVQKITTGHDTDLFIMSTSMQATATWGSEVTDCEHTIGFAINDGAESQMGFAENSPFHAIGSGNSEITSMLMNTSMLAKVSTTPVTDFSIALTGFLSDGVNMQASAASNTLGHWISVSWTVKPQFKMVDVTIPTSGDLVVTGIGFQPTFGIMLSLIGAVNYDAPFDDDMSMAITIFDENSIHTHTNGFENNQATMNDTIGWGVYKDKFAMISAVGSTIDVDSSGYSLDADGITITLTNHPALATKARLLVFR